MNASLNLSLSSIYLDTLLDEYGQSWSDTYLWVIPFAVVGFLGFIANVICFVVLLDTAQFTGPLYQYLRFYVINSAQICIFSGFLFVAYTSRLNNWSNSYGSYVFYLYVYVPLSVTGYFYGTLLDIAITLDRIGILTRRQLIKLSGNKMSTLCLVFAIVINAPYYFAFAPASTTFPKVIDQSTDTITYNYVRWRDGVTGFASSQAGTIILFVLYGFRDLFLMLVEIGLNCVSFYYIRVFMSRKHGVVLARSPAAAAAGAVANQATHVSVVPSGPSGAGTTASVVVAVVAKKSTAEEAASSSVEMKAAVMALTMCALSIVEHVMFVTCIVYPLVDVSGATTNVIYLYWAGDFAILIKHAFNIFIFYAFNKNFKKAIDNYFKFG